MANEDRTLARIQRNPNLSQRDLAGLVGISQTSIHRILKENKYHAFHYVRVHELLQQDFARRTAFCEWFITHQDADKNFINTILFTDECNFSKFGGFNVHNSHHYATENPHLPKVSSSQHRVSINVWAGIIGDRVVSNKIEFIIIFYTALGLYLRFSIAFFSSRAIY